MPFDRTSPSRRSNICTLTALALVTSLTGCNQNNHASEGEEPAALPSGINTDQVAWQQFILAVTPSATSGKVAYETWASDQDIYVGKPCVSANNPVGCNVPTWPTKVSLAAPRTLTTSLLAQSHQALARAPSGGLTVEVVGPAQGCKSPPGIQPSQPAADSGFPATGCVGEEVRRDRATFDYLVKNGLWSDLGLANFYKGGGTVAFPANALEIKVDWIPVTTLATWLGKPVSFVTSNFYTANAALGKAAPPVAMAMTSMHLSVKYPGFPNWIWANFENAYTPGRCDQTGCSDRFGAQVPRVAANSKAWGQYGACAKSAAVGSLMGAAKLSQVFANYCLTGTQTTYGTTTNPTLLGSPIIEALNADVALNQSSCIACHYNAAFNQSGTPNFNNIGGTGPQTLAAGFKQYDFMWGLLGAQ